MPLCPSDLLGIGLLWLCLTLAFEFLFGHFVVGAAWERLAADYNLVKGGLLPIGMAVLTLAPLIAAKLRGVKREKNDDDDFKSPEAVDAFIAKVAERLRTQGQTEAADLLTSVQGTACTKGRRMARGNRPAGSPPSARVQARCRHPPRIEADHAGCEQGLAQAVDHFGFAESLNQFSSASTTEVSTCLSGIDAILFSRRSFSSGVTIRKPCFS